MSHPIPPPTATVAVLDDDHGVRQTVCLMLSDAGYRVLPLPAAPDSLLQIRAARPDAVLIDVWGGQPDRGLSLLDRLRADPATRGIPVVAMSVDGNHPDHRARYLARGCFAVVPKPFEMDELLAVVAGAVAGG